MNMLTIALAKGRLGDQALDLLEESGVDCRVARADTRRLILEDAAAGLRFIMAKPADVPTFVDYGTADVGIVGKDTLLEEGRPLYEVLDLGFGVCRLCVCGDPALSGQLDAMPNKRVATKYPHVAHDWFVTHKRQNVEIIKLNGSVELAPLVGLAEVIVDIVESGRTLRDNGLDVLETIAAVSARLVVNRVSLNLKADRIEPLITSLRQTLSQRSRS